MSIGYRIGQLRARLQVYRGTETVGTLNSVTTTWEEGALLWGGFPAQALTQRSYGAGEAESGLREIEVRSRADVRERDGIEVLAGPEAGRRYRVLDVDRADPKRWMLRVEPFNGVFVEDA